MSFKKGVSKSLRWKKTCYCRYLSVHCIVENVLYTHVAVVYKPAFVGPQKAIKHAFINVCTKKNSITALFLLLPF